MRNSPDTSALQRPGIDPGSFSADLLGWYDAHARVLPWRTPPSDSRRGLKADPYHVWLSEIMLQQTTVAAVRPYFLDFLHRWPTVADLACAPLDDVLQAWAGLGYYARARNLVSCAQAVVARHDGRFPESEQGLLGLPGIGPYTAAAIAAIAFGQRAVVMDGNIERVMARLFRVDEPLPRSKPLLRQRAEELTPNQRPGDHAQALMDLGATICTPKVARCTACPVVRHCAAATSGSAEAWPRKTARQARPTRLGRVYWLEAEGQVLLLRRPPSGLLGGLPVFPGTDWMTRGAEAAVLPPPDSAAPLSAHWRWLQTPVRHVFTHFALELHVGVACLARRPSVDAGFWHPVADIGSAGLPSVMAKVAAQAGGAHSAFSKTR